MLIDIPFIGGGRPLPDFGPPRPIPMPPEEIVPILLKHGFMRFLPHDDLAMWVLMLIVQLVVFGILGILLWRVVKHDRAIQGQ